jgi:hypothetical protein
MARETRRPPSTYLTEALPYSIRVAMDDAYAGRDDAARGRHEGAKDYALAVQATLVELLKRQHRTMPQLDEFLGPAFS